MADFVAMSNVRGVLVAEWDRASRRFIRRDDAGGVIEDRPFTAEENVAADQIVAESAALVSLADRVAAIEGILPALIPAPAPKSEPVWADLVARQAGVVFAGQRFRWIDGTVRECVAGPLNSSATPAACPQGYRMVSPLSS